MYGQSTITSEPNTNSTNESHKTGAVVMVSNAPYRLPCKARGAGISAHPAWGH